MNEFAHASVIMLATSDGRMSEYLSGVDYPVRDVRLALVNESHLKIASANYLFRLYRCNYIPSSPGNPILRETPNAWATPSFAARTCL